jgi:hypothetical protein
LPTSTQIALFRPRPQKTKYVDLGEIDREVPSISRMKPLPSAAAFEAGIIGGCKRQRVGDLLDLGRSAVSD